MLPLIAEAFAMTWSIAQLIKGRQAEQFSLHRRYINTSLARAQAIISFDKVYTRGQGAYLWDTDGHRYLDLLSGYGVFNVGRAHPTLKQVVQDVVALTFQSGENGLSALAGLLAEELAKRMPPGLDAVFFDNSGADAVDTALRVCTCGNTTSACVVPRPRVSWVDSEHPRSQWRT